MRIPSTARYISFLFLCFLLADFILAKIFINLPPVESGIREHHPYFHHGFRSSAAMVTQWGGKEYTIYTNSLGFKDDTVRSVPLQSENHRVVFMGDSFTEGIGMEHADTFVGMIAEREQGRGYEIFNAGVASYSTKLYYLKTRYLLEAVGFRFDEMYVCIDISDIRDEAVYESFHPNETLLHSDIRKAKRSIYLKDRVKGYLKRNSVIGHLVLGGPGTLKLQRAGTDKAVSASAEASASNDPYIQRDLWVYNDSLWNNWGSKGLDLSDRYTKELLELCRQNEIDVTLVIYPKPSTVAAGEISTRHTRHWHRFAGANNVPIIDVTPDFLLLGDARSVIDNYFITGDVHFNRAGNEIMARAIQLD